MGLVCVVLTSIMVALNFKSIQLIKRLLLFLIKIIYFSFTFSFTRFILYDMSELIDDKYARTSQPDGGELASQIVSLLSLTIMSGLFGIKTFNVQFKFLSYSRWLVLILYVLSWAFTMTATVFVSTNNGIDP